MIEGEYLTADDLGPLGRLVGPGDMLVMDPQDAPTVHREREWVNSRYQEADRKAEAMRRRLASARLGPHGAAVRERFEEWTVEAAKLALCDGYLARVAQQLASGNQQVLNLKKEFRWSALEPVRSVADQVISATDDEIASGLVFRAK